MKSESLFDFHFSVNFFEKGNAVFRASCLVSRPIHAMRTKLICRNKHLFIPAADWFREAFEVT